METIFFITKDFDSLMCRLFVFCANGDNLGSEINNHTRPFVKSWINASEDDYNFPIYPKIKNHDHGWGHYQYFLTNDHKEHVQYLRKSDPIYKDVYDFDIDNETTKNFVLLNHSRKASPSMPISLEQNHPFVSESGNLVLIHNGTINKEVLNTFLKEPLTNIENISDTQILFMIFQEKFDNGNNSKPSEIYETWKKLIDDIKNKHAEQNVHYSLNLVVLIKEPATASFNIYYSSLYSKLHFEKYLSLYEFKNSHYTIICSSTIKEYYEKDFADDLKSYTVRLLPNGAIGMINASTNDQIEEQLEPRLLEKVSGWS